MTPSFNKKTVTAISRLLAVVAVAIYFKRNAKISYFKVYPFTSPVKSYFLIVLEKKGNEFLEKPSHECFIIAAKKGNIPF